MSTNQVWFDFELTFPHDQLRKWMLENRNISVYMGLIYLGLLFLGRKVMQNREPFSLRPLLTLWNLFMAAFSILVAVRVVPFFLKRVFSLPLVDQVCIFEYEQVPTLAAWHDIFVITKPMEFIDTIFIVLRKQPLHFLHYYHHITVVILCWFSLGVDPLPPTVIFYVAMNAFVHSVMYTYYLLRSLRISVPKVVQMSITGMQISQMIVGVIINATALVVKYFSERSCIPQYESIFLALGIYATYFALFADFFRKAYFSNSNRKVHRKDKKQN